MGFIPPNCLNGRRRKCLHQVRAPHPSLSLLQVTAKPTQTSVIKVSNTIKHSWIQIEAQTHEAHVQTNCIPKKSMKRVAIEYALYVNIIKTCTPCSSREFQFKHLNNYKLSQPRYKCSACKELFVHNPTLKRRKHPEGYKISREPEALRNAVKGCPYLKCVKMGFAKILYYNKKSLSRPRYKCTTCGVSFQYGGQFTLWNMNSQKLSFDGSSKLVSVQFMTVIDNGLQ